MPKIVNHDERREGIARAAVMVIAERGLESTKLTDIGRLAGVTTGSITHYFEDKDAVLVAALGVAYDMMFENMAKVAKRSNYSLFEILAEALPTSSKSRSAMAVWLAFWSRSVAQASIADQQQDFHNRWHEIVRVELLKYYQKRNVDIPDDLDDVCEGLTAQINGLIIRSLVDPKKWPKRRLHKALERYIDLNL